MKKLFLKLAFLVAIITIINMFLFIFLPLPEGVWGDARLLYKYWFYQEHADEYNTLFIGSSRTFRQISPEIFAHQVSDDLEIKAFNLGSSGLRYPLTEQVYHEVLKNKSPQLKYVIFEIGSVDMIPQKRNLHTTFRMSWYNFKDTLFVLKPLFFHNSSFGSFEKILIFGAHTLTLGERYFHVGIGMDIINYFAGERIYGIEEYRLGRDLNGFYALDHQAIDQHGYVNIKKRQNFFNNIDDFYRMRKNNQKYFGTFEGNDPYYDEFVQRLEGLIKLSESHNVRIVFLLPPLHYPYMYKILLPTYHQLPEGYKISLADPNRYPEFYASENMFDIKHLNYKGSVMFTERLAEEFETVIKEDVATYHADNENQ